MSAVGSAVRRRAVAWRARQLLWFERIRDRAAGLLTASVRGGWRNKIVTSVFNDQQADSADTPEDEVSTSVGFWSEVGHGSDQVTVGVMRDMESSIPPAVTRPSTSGSGRLAVIGAVVTLASLLESLDTMMFEGLRSRWMTPRWCA